MILSLDTISEGIKKISNEYPIKKVTLFGSYADGSFTEESDIDLLVEFHTQTVSLFTLSGVKIGLEGILGKLVDVLHVPLPEAAFPYLRFVLLNGEALYAGAFFMIFFKTVCSCSVSFSYRTCSSAKKLTRDRMPSIRKLLSNFKEAAQGRNMEGQKSRTRTAGRECATLD